MNAARRIPWWMTVAVAGALAVSAGCDKKGEYRLHFSHFTHVTKYEASCADCHGPAAAGRHVRPTHAACVDCHEDWMDKKSISEETCGQCHKKRDLKELGAMEPPEPVAAPAGVFVHTDALTNRCAECHVGVMGEKMTQVPRMTRGDVLRIREGAHRSGGDCRACHVGMDPGTPPPNHGVNWMRRHGQAGAQPDNACSVCHKEQTCRECHQETMPASHNNLWRQKTHGIEAAWDRGRCRVCHEEDSCVACHSEVRPQSHTAAWRETHCRQCHPNSAAGTGCSLCHEGGLDAHPDPHPAGWRTGHCTGCHNGTPEGEQCKTCHEGAGLGSHPNPHAANWRSRHCTECHEGAIGGVSCGACHGGNLADNHPNPHNAGFRRSHCHSCHEGAAASECTVCHRGGSSVLVHQGFWPPVHDRFGGAANCFDCHR